MAYQYIPPSVAARARKAARARPRTIRLPGPDKPPKPGSKPKAAKPKPIKPIKPKPKPKPKVGPAPTPAATGPYARFAGTPYEGYFEDFDKQQANHQAWLTGLLPQVSSGLAAITGVNPASPGYNPQIQQQYMANVAGNVGGALNASAAATPFTPGSNTPGGSMAAPNAYQGAAMSEYARQRGGSAILNAQAQSTLNTLQPNIMAQAAYSKVADYAAGMPAVYAERRSADMLKADQFLAEAQQAQIDAIEEARHNKVTEAISAQNAQTNAAVQFGRLGLDTSKLGTDATESAADRAATNARNAADNRTSAANNAADNAARAASDASAERVAAAKARAKGGTSTRDAKGRLLVPSLQEKGYRRIGPKKPPPKPGFIDVQGADGKWWRKPGTASGGSATTKPRNTADLRSDLTKFYKPGKPGGAEAAHPNDPNGAAVEVARWVRENKSAFARSGRRVDTDRLKDTLTGVIGTNSQVTREATRILRGYMVKRNGVWYWK